MLNLKIHFLQTAATAFWVKIAFFHIFCIFFPNFFISLRISQTFIKQVKFGIKMKDFTSEIHCYIVWVILFGYHGYRGWNMHFLVKNQQFSHFFRQHNVKKYYVRGKIWNDTKNYFCQAASACVTELIYAPFISPE